MAEKMSNTELIQFNYEVYQLGEVKIHHKDPNALDLVKSRTSEYYHICEKYNVIPTWAGLALALGETRQNLGLWREGSAEWVRLNGIQEFIELQYAFLNSFHEAGMLSGTIPTVPGIFVAKNNFGYINEDRETVVHEISTHWSAERLIEEAKNLQISKK